MDTNHFQKELGVELDTLETELNTVGVLRGGVWSPKEPELNLDPADVNVVASADEEYETNAAILRTLDARYREVTAALERIANNTYGLCEVGGEPIEAERLEVNPAARTCLAHM